MEKKMIQEGRMKSYFIQATKELLKNEGLQMVSVRNVADRAGYSYATLYNYFKDLNELIFVCVKDFQSECEEFVVSETEKVTRGRKKIHAITKAYISYFIQYPGIFELFYVERMRSLGNKDATANLIYTFLDRLCDQEWTYCQQKKVYTSWQITEMKHQLRFVTAGMLLYYLNRRNPEDYKEFNTLVDAQIKRTLETEKVSGVN